MAKVRCSRAASLRGRVLPSVVVGTVLGVVLTGSRPAPVARAEPEAHAHGPRVTGVVLGPDGSPVVGARVTVAVEGATAPYGPDVPGPAGPPESNHGISGPDGRFSVAAPPGARRCAVAVETPAGGFAFRRDVAAVARLTLRPAPGAPLTGRVTDEAERPVAGATVRVRCVVAGYLVDRTTTSGPDGRYRLSRLPTTGAGPVDEAAEFWAIDVASAGRAPLVVPIGRLPAGGADRTLVVTRGGTVTLRVRDGGTGRPAPGVKVLLWSLEHHPTYAWKSVFPGQPLGALWSPRVLGEAPSDAEGFVSFRGVSCHGFHSVAPVRDAADTFPFAQFVATGLRPDAVTSGVVQIPSCDPEGARSVEGRSRYVDALSLWSEVTVTGRVVDEGGRPVPEASVGAWSESELDESVFRNWQVQAILLKGYDPRPALRPLTGADGRFLVRVDAKRARPWTVQVAVDGPAHADRRYAAVERAAQVVEGAAVDVGDLTLPFEDEAVAKGPAPGAPVPPVRRRVSVRLPDGTPAAGARVIALRSSGPGRGASELEVVATVGPDGFATWASSGGEHRLLAVAEGWASDLVPVDGWESGAAHASEARVLTMRPVGGRLAGRLRRRAGEAGPIRPAAQVILRGLWRSAAASVGERWERPLDAPIGDPIWETSTDEEENFHLDGIPEGGWRLVVDPRRSRDFGWHETISLDPSSIPARTDAPMPIEWVIDDPPSPPSGRVEGRILDAATGLGPSFRTSRA